MKFTTPLIQGRLIKRYKRFFADVELDGQIVVAHVANTGSLKGCLKPPQDCLIAPANDPSRKLQYSLHMIKDGKSWVGVHTGQANEIVFEAFHSAKVSGWKKFDAVAREVKINSESRLDLVMWKSSAELPPNQKLTPAVLQKHKFHFVEVKNVTMSQGGLAMFPDAVTTRGQKHLEELMRLKNEGHSSEILFLVQRSDCQAFAPADAIDPEYGRLLRQAIKAGVKISAYPCTINAHEVTMKPQALPLEI